MIMKEIVQEAMEAMRDFDRWIAEQEDEVQDLDVVELARRYAEANKNQKFWRWQHDPQ